VKKKDATGARNTTMALRQTGGKFHFLMKVILKSRARESIFDGESGSPKHIEQTTKQPLKLTL
jgi:hypothetical protein